MTKENCPRLLLPSSRSQVIWRMAAVDSLWVWGRTLARSSLPIASTTSEAAVPNLLVAVKPLSLLKRSARSK